MTISLRKKNLWKHPDSLVVLMLLFAGSCGQSQLGDEAASSNSMDPGMMTMTSPSAGQTSPMTAGTPATAMGGVPEAGGSTTVVGMPALGGDPALGGQEGTPLGGQPAAAGTPTRPDVIDDAAVILSVHRHVVVPTFARFKTSVTELKSKIDAFASQPSDESLRAAQEGWKATNAVWQEAELLQFGPTGGLGRVGYENLREIVYSFPGTNACRIDQEVQRERFRDPDWINEPNTGYNIQGLDALEYLLFYTAVDNNCSARNPLNRDAAWDPLRTNPEKLRQNRADLAQVLINKVDRTADTLIARWSTGDGGVGDAFLAGGAPFNDKKTVMNEIFAGLFYIDKKIKDRKLGVPTGIVADGCSADTCPSLIESRYAHVSLDNIVANLRGFRTLFQGGPTEDYVGFDDLLTETGAGDLAEQILSKVEAALDGIATVQGPLDEAIINRLETVREAHRLIKTITDDLKGPFITVLSLTIPQEGAGDSD